MKLVSNNHKCGTRKVRYYLIGLPSRLLIKIICIDAGAVFERLLERKVKEEDIEVDQKIPIVNSESTLLDIPSKYAPKVECAVQAILSAIDPQSDNWETLYEKHGVIAKRRLDGAITVKSESSLPYLASEIFEVLINQNKMKKLDPQTHALKISKSYSSHTFVQYKQLKQVL